MKYLHLVVVALAFGFAGTPVVSAADKKLVLIAGNPSHGYLEHEYRAGCLLLQKCLAATPGLSVTVVSNDWPRDPSVFEGVDAVFMFCTGGEGHPAAQPERLKLLGGLMSKGVGFGTCHFGVEVEKDKGGPEFLAWQGGYFEKYWSVNPTWSAKFTNFPDHPVARGLKPFPVNDEWYYHMRFVDGMKGVTPILTAVPPERTRGAPGANDTHGGNPEVQKHAGEAEHMMWTYERPTAGGGSASRGLIFTRTGETTIFARPCSTPCSG